MSLSIAKLLTPDLIKLELNETKRTTAIHEVTLLLSNHPHVKNLDGFYHEILERERVEPTCLGNHIAFPHARTDHIKQIVLAIGRSSKGILFENANQMIHLIFVIGTPNRLVTDYLALVGCLARILKEASVREQLLSAATPQDFHHILIEAEEKMQAG